MRTMANRPKQTSEYWEKRLKQEQAYMEKATNVGDITEHYDNAINDINKKIEAEYAHLQLSGISKNKVTNADIKAYEREAKELVKYAEKERKSLGRNLTKKDFTDEVNERMKIYNATMRINRLEYLKAETAMSLIKAGVEVDADLQKELSKQYVNERARQAGILGLSKVEAARAKNADKLFKTVAAKTNGATFSQRIWQNTDDLKAKLDVLLTNNVLQGENANVIARRLKTLVAGNFKDNTKYVTERLARTERTRIIGQAQKDSYKENGIEYVKWMAESKACRYCIAASEGGLRGEGVYKIDHEPIYPHHPNCRCSLAAYYDDVNTKTKKETEQYVEAGNKLDDPVLKAIQKLDGVQQNNLKNIKSIVDNAPKDIQCFYKQFGDGNIEMGTGSYYSPADDKITLKADAYTKLDEKAVNPKLSYGTLFHEMGHKVDHRMSFGGVKQSTQHGLQASAKREYKKLAKDKGFDEFINTLSFIQEVHETNDWGAFSDVINGTSSGKINLGSGHYNKKGLPDKSYYSSNLGDEVFANLFETTALNSDGRKLFEKYFPKTTAKFDEILRGNYEEE